MNHRSLQRGMLLCESSLLRTNHSTLQRGMLHTACLCPRVQSDVMFQYTEQGPPNEYERRISPLREGGQPRCYSEKSASLDTTATNRRFTNRASFPIATSHERDDVACTPTSDSSTTAPQHPHQTHQTGCARSRTNRRSPLSRVAPPPTPHPSASLRRARPACLARCR